MSEERGTNARGCPGPGRGSPAALGTISSVSETKGDPPWITGHLDTPVGPVARIATRLSWSDHLGAFRVRMNIGRLRYSVMPGLHAVGSPTADSPVLVSANYKLSFDRLRQELGDLDAWILVLDTDGINVWCAAGKGTFGTEEIVRRVDAAGLARVVSHRTLIVPQLAAPGVAAHEVKRRVGFRVVYGPVRARDLPMFLRAGLRATQPMRRVSFGLPARLALIPVEVTLGGRYALLLAAGLFLAAGLGREGYNPTRSLADGPRAALLIGIAFAGGGILTPALLPWLPGRAFSTKGAATGLVLGCGVAGLGWIPLGGIGGGLEAASWFLMMPAIAAFLAMNFTGASTYTSLSGVRREMRVAVPAQIVAGAIGLAVWVAARFVP